MLGSSLATLSTYDQAGIVVISPTATLPGLGAFGPTTFDRTVVDDTSFDAWYARVATVNRAFRARYAARFGQAPGFFVADLAYDATLVMLDSLERASTIGGGSLVIDRAGLAAAVRKTDGLHGVTCTIMIAANGDRLDDPVALDRCADEA